MKHRTRGLLALLLSAVPLGLAHADASRIDEHRAADPQGTVEISGVAGSIHVSAWDKPEIDVTGTYGDGVERIEVTSSGMRTVIRVIPRSSGSTHNADLKVRVPVKSSLNATLVSADLQVDGVQGDVKIQSISGVLKGEVGGDLRASSVSGDLHLAARAAKVAEVKSISGDITFAGGAGEIDISTVSGTVQATLGGISRGRFKSISGDLHVGLTLAPGARLDGESVSGDVQFEFAALPAGADVDVKTMSGTIVNCFGPKPSESQHGLGSRLMFKQGSGDQEMRITTQSGDVQLCTVGAHK